MKCFLDAGAAGEEKPADAKLEKKESAPADSRPEKTPPKASDKKKGAALDRRPPGHPRAKFLLTGGPKEPSNAAPTGDKSKDTAGEESKAEPAPSAKAEPAKDADKKDADKKDAGGIAENKNLVNRTIVKMIVIVNSDNAVDSGSQADKKPKK